MARESQRKEIDRVDLQLVHPVYLDVPMLVSFVAAVEGGVSFGSEETEKGATSQDRTREASGRTRVGFPLLGALVGMDVSGRYGARIRSRRARRRGSSGSTPRRRSSIFSATSSNCSSRVTALTREEQLENISVGELVEITGEIVGNPLEQMLELFLQILLLPRLDDPNWVDELRDTAMALADFAQRAAQAYLDAQPAGTFTVEPAASNFT